MKKDVHYDFMNLLTTKRLKVFEPTLRPVFLDTFPEGENNRQSSYDPSNF